MDYVAERPNLHAWAEGKLHKQGPDALRDYVAERNAESIDGLPALAVDRAPPGSQPDGVHRAHGV
jgi:hypothetical protein